MAGSAGEESQVERSPIYYIGVDPGHGASFHVEAHCLPANGAFAQGLA